MRTCLEARSQRIEKTLPRRQSRFSLFSQMPPSCAIFRCWLTSSNLVIRFWLTSKVLCVRRRLSLRCLVISSSVSTALALAKQAKFQPLCCPSCPLGGSPSCPLGGGTLPAVHWGDSPSCPLGGLSGGAQRGWAHPTAAAPLL